MENKTKSTKTSTKTARKCLDATYKHLGVNVKSDKYEIWKKYAESKGLSMYALVNELFENAMKNDGFISEEIPEENS